MIEDDLIKSFLKLSYPVVRMRLDSIGNKSKVGRFKRVVSIGIMNYKLSDPTQRYKAILELSRVICQVFHIESNDTINYIKSHLHIK